MNEVYGKTIKEISLCHYFEPEKHDYIKDPPRKQRKEEQFLPGEYNLKMDTRFL